MPEKTSKSWLSLRGVRNERQSNPLSIGRLPRSSYRPCQAKGMARNDKKKCKMETFRSGTN